MFLLSSLLVGLLFQTAGVQPISANETLIGNWSISAIEMFETQQKVDEAHAGDKFNFNADGTLECVIRGQLVRGDWMCDAANTWLSISDAITGTGFRFKILYLNEGNLKVDYGYYEDGAYLHDILLFTRAD